MSEKWSPEILLGIGGIIGIALTRLGRTLISKKFSEAAKIREELRMEAKSLRAEIHAVYSELDSWKQKYYVLIAENLRLKNDCARLESEIQSLRSEMGVKPRSSQVTP